MYEGFRNGNSLFIIFAKKDISFGVEKIDLRLWFEWHKEC